MEGYYEVNTSEDQYWNNTEEFDNLEDALHFFLETQRANYKKRPRRINLIFIEKEEG